MVWLLEQMSPRPCSITWWSGSALKGRLDVELLRRCIDEVIKRHEILRTVYPVISDRPMQRVESPITALFLSSISGIIR